MSNLSTFKDLKDNFNCVKDYTKDDVTGVLLSFNSADIFITNSIFGLTAKVVRLDTAYLKDFGGSKIFIRGEFKDFLVDSDNNLIGCLFSNIKGNSSVLSIKLNNYLLDIKMFEDDLIAKVFDNRCNRIGYTAVNMIGGPISVCV